MNRRIHSATSVPMLQVFVLLLFVCFFRDFQAVLWFRDERGVGQVFVLVRSALMDESANLARNRVFRFWGQLTWGAMVN